MTLERIADVFEDIVGSTPAALAGSGGTAMSLVEINEHRKKLVSEAGEWTKEDGTFVPAVYNKLRVLVNTYGMGVGRMDMDDGIDLIMMLFSEEDAQTYLEMPYGVLFSAAEFAAASGRGEKEWIACQIVVYVELHFRLSRFGPLAAH